MLSLKPWTHWHSKTFLGAAIGLTVWAAMMFGYIWFWVATGFCAGILLADTVLWRFWMMNRQLMNTVQEQQKLIEKLGATKADDVAQRIAQRISEITGHDVEMIKIPNESFKKDKLH